MTATVTAIRRCYLAALCVLQIMLAWQLVPIIALVLMRHVPLGRAADGWPAVLEIASAALCVVGAGLSLAYPSIVLMRHAQRGPQRFAGLPIWAVVLTFSGCALLAVDGAVRMLAPWLPIVQQRPLGAALPLAAPGVALMCAGALFAELLRRTRPAYSRTLPEIAPIVRVQRVPRFADPDAPSFQRVA